MMRILQGLTLVALIMAVSGCNPAPPKREGGASDFAASGASGPPLAPKAMDVGDAETALRLEATIGDKSRGPSVKVDETRDTLSRLVMTTADVAPPVPKELWASFKLTSSTAFKERPVVVRTKVFRDNTKIDEFAVVLGADATSKPFVQSLDVLSGLPAAPASLLVHAQADVILMQAGTDPATVDPKTAAAAADTTGAVLSNPVRINFATAGR
jgi:hypothetical protein